MGVSRDDGLEGGIFKGDGFQHVTSFALAGGEWTRIGRHASLNACSDPTQSKTVLINLSATM